MPQIINTNIASLNAQRNLNKSQSDLGVSLQRLSSGLRINSAKDDAAGLAISERFSTQIKGLNQAARNANDGISLAQTAEGALGGVTNLLQRVRELSVQSANATNNSSDRAALQSEVTQLVDEINRVADTTTFNGVKLLDGSFSAQAFQVGANANQTVSIASIADANTDVLGLGNTATATGTGPVTAGVTGTGELIINGTDVFTAAGGAVAQDAAALATAISSIDGVSATATNAQTAIAFTDVVGTVASGATPSTQALGALTVNATTDVDATNSYTLTFDNTGDGGTDTLAINVTNVANDGSDFQSKLVASFVSAGFTDVGGGGTVSGYTLDLGGQASITAALANDTLTVQRADGIDFTTAETNDGGFSNAPAFANGTATTTDGVQAISAAAPTYTLDIDGNTLDFTAAGADGTISGTEVAALIDAISGYTSSFSGGNLSITKADGSNIVLTENGSDSAAGEGLAGGDGTTANVSTSYGTLSITSTNADLAFTGTLGAGLATGLADATAAISAGTGVGSIDISTASGAQTAIDIVDRALTEINTSRADLGALQNRFEAVVSNISITSENLTAARSRIQDADFAAETASLTRNQILQQAGVSILAQANGLPQLALSLLQ